MLAICDCVINYNSLLSVATPWFSLGIYASSPLGGQAEHPIHLVRVHLKMSPLIKTHSGHQQLQSNPST